MTNPIIPTWLFYFASVVDNIRSLGWFAVFFCAAACFLVFTFGLCESKDSAEEEKNLRLLAIYGIALLISISVVVIIPSRGDIQAMIANRYVTQQNLEGYDGTLAEMIDAILDKVKAMMRQGK